MKSKRKRTRLHYNKGYRKIGWLKTNVNAKSYRTVRGYVNRLLSDGKNYKEYVRRLEAQTPGIFDNVGILDRNDKESVISFAVHHAQSVYDDMKKRNPNVTLEQAVRKEFNTRAYVSQDELIQTNVKTHMQRRKNKEKADKIRELLGTNKIPYGDLVYNPQASLTNELGQEELVKAYVFKGTDIGIVMQGSGTGASPYLFDVQVLDNIQL